MFPTLRTPVTTTPQGSDLINKTSYVAKTKINVTCDEAQKSDRPENPIEHWEIWDILGSHKPRTWF